MDAGEDFFFTSFTSAFDLVDVSDSGGCSGADPGEAVSVEAVSVGAGSADAGSVDAVSVDVVSVELVCSADGVVADTVCCSASVDAGCSDAAAWLGTVDSCEGAGGGAG